MYKSRIKVLYRENCGGILRNLAAGLRRSVNTLSELELYDDLRERIFREDRLMVTDRKDEPAA